MMDDDDHGEEKIRGARRRERREKQVR